MIVTITSRTMKATRRCAKQVMKQSVLAQRNTSFDAEEAISKFGVGGSVRRKVEEGEEEDEEDSSETRSAFHSVESH